MSSDIATPYQLQDITTADGLQLHVRCYGAKLTENDKPSSLPVLCLHGLTRTGVDFEPLFNKLSAEGKYSFIVPDLRGRGESDYDPHPENYELPTYLSDCQRILEHFSIQRFAILGSSLGGLLAMELHRLLPASVCGIALSDIGPILPQTGLVSILSYVGMPGKVTNWEEATAFTQARLSTDYPSLTPDQWRDITTRSYKEHRDGSLTLIYDPKISVTLKTAFKAGYQLDLWDSFEGITQQPLLCLRGELSRLLTPELLLEMQERNPHLTTALIPERGHVPLLDEPESVTAIQQWLDASLDHLNSSPE